VLFVTIVELEWRELWRDDGWARGPERLWLVEVL
jgi:hypothetical protein